MEDNPVDPCCKRPVCQPGPNGQVTGVAVPSYKPGFTGYGLAKNPTLTASGNIANGFSGTSGGSTFTGSGSSQTISGARSEFSTVPLWSYTSKSRLFYLYREDHFGDGRGNHRPLVSELTFFFTLGSVQLGFESRR